MSHETAHGNNHGTGKLGDFLIDLSVIEPQVVFRPAPHIDPGLRPVWRVRFDLAYDSSQCFGLEINDEIHFGRGDEAPDHVSLNRFRAEELGVSRNHLLLRPTDTHLYVVDTGSTNGTWRNGQSIGVNVPASLSNGDVLRLGELELIIRIIRYPVGRTHALARIENPDSIVSPIAQALTSLLDLNDVLRKAIDMAITETGADEASIWLVDERTGDLYLEADHGIQDSTIRRMRLPVVDSLAGMVIETGLPQRANAHDHSQPIKVKTGYLVNAVVYVPLTLAGVTFGVLSAAHHKPDVSFSKSDEHLLATIGEFTAIAVQNARTYQAATAALTRRDKVLTALNYAHAYDFKNLISAMIGYAGLLESYNTLHDEAASLITDLSRTGDSMLHLLTELHEISTFGDTPSTNPAVCNLISVTGRAVADVRSAAANRSVVIDLQFSGTPYPILGDASRLYRGIFRLVDHAVRYSPDGAPVFVLVHFTDTHVSIHVHDSGPSIPAEDLPHVFERYSRGGANSEGHAGVELGLALVWAAAEAHRGRVEARATQDEGAEFVITLPATLRVSEESSDARETHHR